MDGALFNTETARYTQTAVHTRNVICNRDSVMLAHLLTKLTAKTT